MNISPFSVVMFFAFITCVVLANLIDFIIVGKVNLKKTDIETTSYVGWTLGKSKRLVADYRRYYPTGKLHFLSRFVAVLATIFLFLTVLSAFNLRDVLTYE